MCLHLPRYGPGTAVDWDTKLGPNFNHGPSNLGTKTLELQHRSTLGSLRYLPWQAWLCQ